MSLNFRFAVVSDLHIALPHTIWNHPSRFQVEVSIQRWKVLEHLEQQKLDFLLLPGVKQHGESENHAWFKSAYPSYLSQSTFPAIMTSRAL